MQGIMNFVSRRTCRSPGHGGYDHEFNCQYAGSGNAATPLGIKAMNELQRINKQRMYP